LKILDEMNITPYLDNFMKDQMISMEPHYSVPEMNGVCEVSGRLTLTGPVVATISNHLANERKRLKGVV